jgi:cytochrome c-type biogenesis protein CcmF
VKPPAYNKVVLPMGLALAAVMATGPVLGHGGGAGRKAWRKLLAMGGAGAAVGVVVALMGFSAIWAVSAGAVVAAVIAGVVIDVVGALRARVGAGEGVAAAGVKVVSSGLRHWGAQVAHLGLAAIVAGVAGSSTYQWQHEFLGLEEGQAKTEDGVTVTFHGLAEEKRPTYDMMVARVDVADAKGRVDTLRPEVRFYHTKPDQPVWKVAVGLGLGTDVYVRLLGTDEKTGTWALQVIRNPLVNWIWVGGALLVIGGGMCLAPVGRKGANRTTEAPRPTEKEKEDGITVRRGTLRERRRQCV